MARMPGTVWVGEQSPGIPMSHYDIVCVHTIVGYAPAHAAHFSTKADGTILQSRDTAYRSGANLDGNHRVIAIENEDHGPRFGGTPRLPEWVALTPEQVVANARILAWAYKVHGVPLQMCPDSRPDSRGLAYHRQGIDGNFGGYKFPGRVAGGEVWTLSPGKVCPTDVRIAQRAEILARAIVLAGLKPKHFPVRVAFSNLNMFQGGDSEHIAGLAEDADVLQLVECIDSVGRPIPIADYLPQNWAVAQDTSSSAKAGSVVAWRTDVLKAYRKPALKLLTDEVKVGGKVRVRTRYVMVQPLKVIASGEKYRMGAGHFPPDEGEAWRATWPAGVARVRAIRARPFLPPFVGGFDRNDEIDAFADDLHMIAEGQNIVGVVLPPKRVRVVSSRIDPQPKAAGLTDHVDVHLTVTRK